MEVQIKNKKFTRRLLEGLQSVSTMGSSCAHGAQRWLQILHTPVTHLESRHGSCFLVKWMWIPEVRLIGNRELEICTILFKNHGERKKVRVWQGGCHVFFCCCCKGEWSRFSRTDDYFLRKGYILRRLTALGFKFTFNTIASHRQ